MDIMSFEKSSTGFSTPKNQIRASKPEIIKSEAKKMGSCEKTFEKLNLSKKKFPVREKEKLNHLKRKHCQLNLEFKMMHKQEETRRTGYEIKFEKKLRQSCKLEILDSFLILNHCLDFFIPSLGYGIEIDGGIHNAEFKQKKDNLRDTNLGGLKIPTMVLNNEDLDYALPSLILSIRKGNRKSHYQKSRLLRDIYLSTLIHHNISLFD